jgi:hypothetical protein
VLLTFYSLVAADLGVQGKHQAVVQVGCLRKAVSLKLVATL